MALTEKEKKSLKIVAKSVKDGDLYRALHYVGDDPVKSSIEDFLKDVLSKSQYNKVVAVFKAMTDDEIYSEYFAEEE